MTSMNNLMVKLVVISTLAAMPGMSQTHEERLERAKQLKADALEAPICRTERAALKEDLSSCLTKQRDLESNSQALVARLDESEMQMVVAQQQAGWSSLSIALASLTTLTLGTLITYAVMRHLPVAPAVQAPAPVGRTKQYQVNWVPGESWD